jgi:hypothetical protein
VTAVTRAPGDQPNAHIWLSSDCGETWKERAQLDKQVRSIAWIERDGEPVLLMASEAGLFQLAVAPGTGPALIELSEKITGVPPLAVVSGVNADGQTCVAVALSGRTGVWLSRDGGRMNTFRAIELDQVDVRTLQVQAEGSRLRLQVAGEDVSASAVVLATGASYRGLDVPALEKMTDAGVFYSASTQGQALSGEALYVVGGGNSAGQAAIHLSRYAGRVTLVIRGESLSDSMSRYLRDALEATENVEVRYRAEVVDAVPDED